MDPTTQQPVPPEAVQPPVTKEISPKSSLLKVLLSILGIVIVLGLGGASYLGTQKNKIAISSPQVISPTQTVTPTIILTPTSIDVTQWKTFTSPLGYSLQYPVDWVLNPKYTDPNGGVGKETISLADSEGDRLLFDYGYRPLGVPPHVFKTENITIDGIPIIKAYNDGCDFNADGTTAATATCKNVATMFYQITYAIPDGLSNDPTVVDSTPGTKDYAWTTGSQSVSLGMSNFHGKPSYLAFILHDRLSISDPTFQKTNAVLDKIITSITFSK